jgi:DNA-binding transcriptional MerR regulator
MDGPSPAVMGIGQMAERTGLSVHTLRFYEREGILANPIRRGPGGRRFYTDDDAEWLTVCVNLRATGMPIPAIRQYTGLVRGGDGSAEEVLELLRRHQARVLAQMDTLRQCLDLISHKVLMYESITGSTSPASPCAPADAASSACSTRATAGLTAPVTRSRRTPRGE